MTDRRNTRFAHASIRRNRMNFEHPSQSKRLLFYGLRFMHKLVQFWPLSLFLAFCHLTCGHSMNVAIELFLHVFFFRKGQLHTVGEWPV